MLNRLLLLCPLVILLFGCSDKDTDSQPHASLPDTCLLTSIQYDSLNTDSIVYDPVTFLPKYTLRNGVIERIYTYSNNEYKIVVLRRNRSDTSSVETFTVDADKKVIRMVSRRKQADRPDIFITRTCEYNPNNTIKSIRGIGYSSDINGIQIPYGSPGEQRFGWTNGNLTSDSTFFLLDINTPQERKSLFDIRTKEYSSEPDLKGLAGLYYDFYRIPGLFGKGSRNLVSKETESLGTYVSKNMDISYILNTKGWVTSLTSTGIFNSQTANYQIKYGYTCYKRK